MQQRALRLGSRDMAKQPLSKRPGGINFFSCGFVLHGLKPWRAGTALCPEGQTAGAHCSCLQHFPSKTSLVAWKAPDRAQLGDSSCITSHRTPGLSKPPTFTLCPARLRLSGLQPQHRFNPFDPVGTPGRNISSAGCYLPLPGCLALQCPGGVSCLNSSPE